MRLSTFEGIQTLAVVLLCTVSVGCAAYAITTNLNTIKRIDEQKSEQGIRLDEIVRSAQLREAYQLGAFYEVLCNSPKLAPQTKDTTPCVRHFERLTPQAKK